MIEQSSKLSCVLYMMQIRTRRVGYYTWTTPQLTPVRCRATKLQGSQTSTMSESHRVIVLAGEEIISLADGVVLWHRPSSLAFPGPVRFRLGDCKFTMVHAPISGWTLHHGPRVPNYYTQGGASSFVAYLVYSWQPSPMLFLPHDVVAWHIWPCRANDPAPPCVCSAGVRASAPLFQRAEPPEHGPPAPLSHRCGWGAIQVPIRLAAQYECRTDHSTPLTPGPALPVGLRRGWDGLRPRAAMITTLQKTRAS